MKTFIPLLLTVCFAGNSLFAQNESFFQSVDDILYHSNKTTAFLMMEEKHSDFKLVNGNFDIIDSATFIIDGKDKKVAYERMQFVSAESKAIIQLIYVDDMLYGKNISFYFHGNQSSIAEEKYNAINHALVNSNELQLLMSGSGDEVYFKDDQIAAGKIRHYPAKRVHYDVWEGTAGIILNIPDIYKLEDIHKNKGIWVFVSAYNTFGIPLSTKYPFPKVDPPYTTIEELISGTN